MQGDSVQYQPELGTVMDLAEDSSRGNEPLLPRVLRFGLEMRHHMEGPFFVFHFCLTPQFCLGFSFIMMY